MAFMDFVKPKWQHSNPEVRLEAVRKMSSDDRETLFTLVQTDPEPAVRQAVILQLTSLDDLEKIDSASLDDQSQKILTNRIELLLTDKIIANASEDGRDSVARLTDPNLLARVAMEAERPELRIEAITRIDDQQLLARILERQSGKEPARIAIDKIEALDILQHLTTKASGKAARRLAEEKLAALQAELNKPTAEELLALELQKICTGAQQLADSAMHENSPALLEELKQKWRQLDGDGAHALKPDFDRISTAFDDKFRLFEERCAEERRKADLYAKRFADYEQICVELSELATATDGESEKRLQVLTDQWLSLQTDSQVKLPPTEALKTRFDDACKGFRESREKIARELRFLAELEGEATALESADLLAGLTKVGAQLEKLQEKYGSRSLQFVNVKPLKQRLNALQKSIEDARLALETRKDQARQENISARTKICSELEKLITTEKKLSAENKGAKLQQEWDNLAKLAGPDIQELEDRYQKTLQEFNDQQKKFFHEQEWQLWANKTKKEELIAAAQNLEKEEDLGLVADSVKDLQALWKEIGPVPRDISQRLWDRFHALCDSNFTRCQPYFDGLEQQRLENLVTLEKLCEAAEALSESTEWQSTSDKLKKLQAEWKTIQPVPRRKADKLFVRFRAACNIFFERRHENYQQGDQERRKNLAAKEALCVEAEQLAEQPAWDDSPKYRELQSRWKRIGHVPKDHEDRVWSRFRSACDKYFNWLDQEREQNFNRKEELCREASEIVAAADESDGAAMKAGSARLTELQQLWKEIGAVPQDKKDEQWERFHQICDSFFSVRRQQFEEQDKIRRQHQQQKENLLYRAEELAGGEASKETAEELKKLQEEWKSIGQAPKEQEAELNKNFKAALDSYFEGRRQYFEEINLERTENLKKRETLCLRLESIVGFTAVPEKMRQSKALSLAEQLKMAMEENTIMAGHLDDPKNQLDEVRRIQEEWKTIGTVARKHEQMVWNRFKAALDVFYAKDKAAR